MKTYKTLLESYGPDCASEGKAPSKTQIRGFIDAWKTACRKFFDSAFDLSNHFLYDRLTHERNYKDISTCELTFVFNKFFKANVSMVKQDAQAVKDGTAVPRGRRREEMKDNELEYVVSSRSTDIHVVLVLKRDRGKAGTSVLLPVTIMRQRRFRASKGQHFIVEGVKYDEVNHFIVD